MRFRKCIKGNRRYDSGSNPVVTSVNRFRWRVLVAMLATTLVIFIAFCMLVPPAYLTNDDVGVRRAIEGLTAPGAAPTGSMLVAHSPLGWTLAWLRGVVPAHLWDLVVGGLLIWSIAMALTAACSITAGSTHVGGLLNLHPSLLILHSDSFPSEHRWRPFHTPSVQLTAIQLGLNNHNPSVDRFLMRYDPSLLSAIGADSAILVISERRRLDPVTTFMREHYHVAVEWNEVYQGSFRAWHCSTKDAR